MLKDTWEVQSNVTQLTVNEIIDKIWVNRGVKNANSFLHPLNHYILPSEEFKNIKGAAATFINALKLKHRIVVYADVDTDGCTSAAIMCHYIRRWGIEPFTYINEGKVHGIQEEFLSSNLYNLADLIIVVDSFNSDTEIYDRICRPEDNKALIVLDHHTIKDSFKPLTHIYNIVSSANDYPNPHLSGSGVTWKFCRYIDELSGTSYAEEFIDLAAVGIIADVCNVGPNSLENRTICHLGFDQVVNPGLVALLGKSTMTSTDIEFTIAPLINAANRMRSNKVALDLFLAETSVDAKKFVKHLKKLREDQKALIPALEEMLINQVEAQKEAPCYYFMMAEGPKELTGLLATRLCAKYCRPVMVLHESDTQYAGSMRAKGLEDFGKIINESGLGEALGHENSAGIVIPKENFESFKSYIQTVLSSITFKESVKADITITRTQITPYLLTKLKEINRISGEGFPSIKVLIEDIDNYKVNELSGGKHLCIETSDMKFIIWNFSKWETIHSNSKFSAIGTLEENFFAGRRSIQVLMDDYYFYSAKHLVF